MATIPRAALDYLTEQINACSADAQAKALKLLEKIDWSDVAAARQIVVEVINMLVAEYGLASAQAAADFYDASRELCTGEKLGAKAYTDIDPKATEGAIRAFVNKIVEHDDVEGFNRATCSRIDYEMKRSAGHCMMRNGARDPLKPRFARVPSGAETCKFCLMLASRGFVYHSKKSAGALDHYHDGCDCRIVCSWDDDGAEGYDPDALAEKWRELKREGAKDSAKRKDVAREKRSMMSLNDPAKEYFGAAEESNPDELRELMARLERDGVELRKKQGEAMAYSPSVVPGLPGQIMYSDGMSWPAWLHENDHYERDRELGFPGLIHYLGDIDLWDSMEERAYGLEIEYAVKHGYNELANRLRILLDEDKRARRV